MKVSLRPLPLVALALLGAVAILLVDLSSPIGVADGVLYVGVVLASLWLPYGWGAIALAGLASAFVVSGYLLSPGGGDPAVAITNRVLALLAIWTTAGVVTWRNRSAGRLQEEQEVLRAVMDTTVDGVITIDERGIILTFSSAAEKLFGYREAEVVGRNVKLLMPEPDRGAHDGYLRRYLETGEARIIGTGRIVEALRSDGSRFPTHLVVGEGRRSGRRFFTGFVHDVTERLKAEREAAEQRHFADSILDTTDAMVVVVNPAGHILRCNRTFEQTLGYQASEVIGQVWWNLAPAEARATVERRFRSLLDRGGVGRVERDWRTKTGETRRVVFSSSAVADDEGAVRYAVITGVDVTDERRAETRVKSLQNDLYRIGRLSELGEMASAIAHELNQPLTAIANYARASRKLLGEEAGPHARAADFMEKAVAQADRAGQIIRRLRQLIGRGETESRPCDINQAVRDACDLAIIGAAQQGIDAHLELSNDLPPVLADSTQVQQVAFNLVRNAIDALQDCPDQHLVVRTGVTEEGAIEVSVEDSGHGLAPEVAERLFTPFMTTKPNGMGIGLSICRSIIEAHGGEIWAEANPKGGTTFRFTLPAANAALEEPTEKIGD